MLMLVVLQRWGSGFHSEKPWAQFHRVSTRGVMTLSSTGIGLKGIRSIRSTSVWWNKPQRRFVSHLLVTGLISSETLASSKPGTTCDLILGQSSDGSQASFQTLIDSPHPTLHLAPLKSTSLPWSMLLHACEPDIESVASIIVQSGKNFGLKTL